ncbi:MAG TPA: hypothetical protein VNQ77_06790 [Frankiaceae bacterium]|nr:hypothetical protein [Frankiaceae bacterium]
MRRLLALVALGTGLTLTPAAADPLPVRVPLCDLEGHCDRACYVGGKPVVYCGVGR